MLRNVFLFVALLLLPACTTFSDYSPGKSTRDVPHAIRTIAVRQIYMVEQGLPADKKFINGEPVADKNPSQNDREVIEIVRKTVISQLKSHGYVVLEGQNVPADIGLKFFVDYFPERWPLLDRTLSIRAHMLDAEGKLIFKTYSYRLTAGLIGALAGPGRDEFVASTAIESVNKTVTECRKGMKYPPIPPQPPAPQQSSIPKDAPLFTPPTPKPRNAPVKQATSGAR